MKKRRLAEDNSLTLEEGCNKYLDNCRARNMREGTINHYRQSYVQFAKFFDMNMPIMEMDEKIAYVTRMPQYLVEKYCKQNKLCYNRVK